MIEVSQLNKQYGSRWAIRDVSFTVKKGEVVGFLGPNGAGKTTTMKIITGAMVADSGTVKIDDEDIFYYPIEVKKKIGYLPEIPPVYEDMYVESYLRYVAVLKNCSKSELPDLIDSALKKTGLEEVKGRLIQNLSKGFRQRLGLAQALISNPEVLILDEPTVGLDPNQVIEMRNLINQLKGQHTVILSTHILSEVEAICDRVIIIKEGQIVTQESLGTLREKQMESQRRIIVRVKKLSEKLKDDISRLKGVAEVQQHEKGYVISVDSGVGSELNEQIVRLVIEGGYGLMELNETFSLEDVFLNVTGRKDQQKK